MLVDQVGATLCVVLSMLEKDVGRGPEFFSGYIVAGRLEK